ncbi:hypothetical protein ACIQWR_26155 [Streptomyces sp. NPDC098789]|uniref:hypothetical protein n=1 Tax=Streptomyces sp. NPDC098789 TaxID=3366098 RepID=UPI00380ED934
MAGEAGVQVPQALRTALDAWAAGAENPAEKGNGPAASRDRFGTGGRGLPGLLWNKGAKRREGELSTKYGIEIGPGPAGGTHFSHSEINKIDKVLGTLPRRDLADNKSLRGLVRGGGQGGLVSLFDPDTSRVHIQHPVGLPAWLYTRLQRGSGWQRRLMDLGAAAGYDGLSIGQRCSVLGRSRDRRQVMGKVLSHGSLLSWTLRHEIGHSVDQQHQWLLTDSAKPEFGGWQAHLGSYGCRAVARAFLAPYGITEEGAIHWLAHRIAPDSEGVVRVNAALASDLTRDLPEAGRTLGQSGLRQLVRDLGLATEQPWMLPKGGTDRLTRDGRVYQVDQYGSWCSYLASARHHGVSPYQFSSADEFFAESYAAFHDPVAGTTLRRRLHPDAATWFKDRTQQPRPEEASC